MEISELWLSVRAQKVLESAGIKNVDDLADWNNWRKVLKQKQCGKKTMAEICWALLDVSSGDLIKRKIEWGKKFQPKPSNYDEFEDKAYKYDKIMEIIGKL